MSDDLSRDLEQIHVPAIPNDYAALKSLIQTLPTPLSPEIRSATTGGTNTVTPGVTAAAQNAGVLSGAPIGQESGAGLGRYPELFYGQSNALVDPTFEKLPLWTYPTTLAEGVWTACGPNWEGRKTLTSGTNPTATICMGADREYSSRWYGGGSSALANIAVTPAAAPCVSVIELRCTQAWGPSYNSTMLTNIVNAVRVRNYNGGSAGFSYVVEVLLTGDSNVVKASSSLTSNDLGVGSLFRRLWCSLAGTPAALTSEYWQLVVRLTVTYTSTFSPIQGIYLAEPQMSFSATEQPPPYTPIVAAWSPRDLTGRTAHIEPIDAASSYMGWWDVVGDLPATESALRLRLAGDTNGRVVVGLASAFGSGIGFGPGGASDIDVAINRQAAGTVKISVLNSTADEALMIGDDSTLFDVDIADRLGIKGQATAANGGFVFGSGKDTNLYRGGANQLKTDDQFVVGVTGMANKDNLLIPDTTAGAGLTIGSDTNLYRAQADVLKTDDQLHAAGGLTLLTVAGAVSDSNFVLDQSGNMALDSTNSRLYVRVGTTWKYVNLI